MESFLVLVEFREVGFSIFIKFLGYLYVFLIKLCPKQTITHGQLLSPVLPELPTAGTAPILDRLLRCVLRCAVGNFSPQTFTNGFLCTIGKPTKKKKPGKSEVMQSVPIGGCGQGLLLHIFGTLFGTPRLFSTHDHAPDDRQRRLLFWFARISPQQPLTHKSKLIDFNPLAREAINQLASITAIAIDSRVRLELNYRE